MQHKLEKLFIVENVAKKMKYKNEYNNTLNKNEFVEMVLENYPNIKEATAKRRYYDMKKLYGVQSGRYTLNEKTKPRSLKILELKDMKRLNKKITKEYLIKYGFNDMEINWLEDEMLLK